MLKANFTELIGEAKLHPVTSMMTPTFGTAALIARAAVQTRFFGFRASDPVSSRRLGSV